MHTIIDWLAFRTKTDHGEAFLTLQAGLGALGGQLTRERRVMAVKPPLGAPMGTPDRIVDLPWQGYATAWDLRLGEFPFGLLATGGAQMNGWTYVSLPGQACACVMDWPSLERTLLGLASLEFKRVDIALDVFGGVGYDDAAAAWERGDFNFKGRRPSRDVRGVPETGRTFYVGSRKTSTVFFRNYEKGLHERTIRGTETVNGYPVADWFRLEAELKPVAGLLPLDTIARRDEYFAGLCPWYATVLAGVHGAPFARGSRPRAGDAELHRTLAQIRRQYGPALFTAAAAFGNDTVAVWALIVGDHHSSQLARAGCCGPASVVHEALQGVLA